MTSSPRQSFIQRSLQCVRTRKLRGKVAFFAILIGLTTLIARSNFASQVEIKPLVDPPTIPPIVSPVAAIDAPRIEVVFVLDTTGSMSGLIEGAKQKVWSIANRLASGQPAPEIKLGLIGYRDRGDEYVTRAYPLSQDIDALYENLMSFHADGGGDTPESVNLALHEAVNKIQWNPDDNVYKVIFLVGDAPPHTDYQDEPGYQQIVKSAARQGIIINTVQCGSDPNTSLVWKEIAKVGSGQYAMIEQNGGMVAEATPMDDELSVLNRELAKTTLAYGKVEEKEELRKKVKNSLAAAPAAVASRLSYFDKTGASVSSGRGDLVDAIEKGDADLSALSKDDLPAEMQEMELEEQKKYVATRSEDRRQVKAKIAKLARERDSYLKQEDEKRRAEGADMGFDGEVYSTIREQAAAKGIVYE